MALLEPRPAGRKLEYLTGLRVFTAPVDFAPPAAEVCRTPAQRLRWAAAGAAFVWCTVGAL